MHPGDPYLARVRRSCGDPAHMLTECPVLYYADTNNDHSRHRSDSIVGKAWMSKDEILWQKRLILPGYGIRQRCHPAGSSPYLMCNSKKAKTNHRSGSQNQGNQNQGNQNHGTGNRGNQNQGNQNLGTGNQGSQNYNHGNQKYDQGNLRGNQGGGRGYQGKRLPRGW